MDMNNKKGILWFRNDLRIHDNEALHDALSHVDVVYPIYVFDPRIFRGKTSFGFPKTGVYRAKFIIESILDLRISLKRLGSQLIVLVGHPEEVISKFAKEHHTHWVFCNRERTQEEVDVQDRLERALWSIGQELRYSRGKMLYYTSDLPFPITHTPDTFTQFRKEVERIVEIRTPLPEPRVLKPFSEVFEVGDIPSLTDLGYPPRCIVKSENTAVKGGEREGLEILQHHIELLGNTQSNNDLDALRSIDHTSKISPYLSQGCLSPKQIYHLLDEKKTRGLNGVYELYIELLWRDFFRLMGKKHGNAIFQKGGIKREVIADLKDDMDVFRIWSEGRTGAPIVDAAMTELNTTGLLSFKARQVSASFLIHDLKVNWQIGASYFESMLTDYDPCSNWGNWNQIAGVAFDSRGGKHINTINYAKRHDPLGYYVKKWIPALSVLESARIHEPYMLSQTEQNELGLMLGRDYPRICVAHRDL